jgi:hypothetical protein
VPDNDTEALLENLAMSGDYLSRVGTIDVLLPPPVIPQDRRPLSDVVAELRDAERW